jgi:hypothetical protein
VWEGGFDERLGGPPAGYVDLSGVGRAWCGKRRQFREKPFRYELQVGTTVSNEGNLTNERTVRHLQKCISGSEAKPGFARFCCISVTADSRKGVGWNRSKMDVLGNFLLFLKVLANRSCICSIRASANLPGAGINRGKTASHRCRQQA